MYSIEKEVTIEVAVCNCVNRMGKQGDWNIRKDDCRDYLGFILASVYST